MDDAEFCQQQAHRCREIATKADDQPEVADALRRIADELMGKVRQPRGPRLPG